MNIDNIAALSIEELTTLIKACEKERNKKYDEKIRERTNRANEYQKQITSLIKKANNEGFDVVVCSSVTDTGIYLNPETDWHIEMDYVNYVSNC